MLANLPLPIVAAGIIVSGIAVAIAGLVIARRVIPPVLWLGLLAGAMLTVTFSYFFGARSLALQVLMTAGFAGTISLFIFVILILDAPFAGSSPVSREPFARALRVMTEDSR